MHTAFFGQQTPTHLPPMSTKPLLEVGVHIQGWEKESSVAKSA